MKLRRIIASLFLVVALLGAGFVPAASAAPLQAPAKASTTKAKSAKPKATKVKTTTKPTIVTERTLFAVKGKVSPVRKGVVLELQKWSKSKGKWVYVARGKSNSRGTFVVKGKISLSSAKSTLRVVSLKSSRYAKSVSSKFKVDVISKKAAKAVTTAKKQVGDRYRYGASGPSSFDCSGLTSYAYKKSGVKLSHSAKTQSKKGKKVAKKDLKPGDLVFFYAPISHVGIYIGHNKIVHAGSRKTGVEVAKMSWMPYSGARRVA